MEGDPIYNSINFVQDIEYPANQTGPAHGASVRFLCAVRRLAAGNTSPWSIRRRPTRRRRSDLPGGLVELRRLDREQANRRASIHGSSTTTTDHPAATTATGCSIAITRSRSPRSPTAPADLRRRRAEPRICLAPRWTGAVTNAAVPLVALQAEGRLRPGRWRGRWSSPHTGEGHAPNSPSAWRTGDQYWSMHPGRRQLPLRRRQRPVHQGTRRLHDLPGARNAGWGRSPSRRTGSEGRQNVLELAGFSAPRASGSPRLSAGLSVLALLLGLLPLFGGYS